MPLVNIPGVDPNAGVLTYLSGLYNFLISVVGILAMAVIIYGGMRYLTSAGNPSSVEEAKDAITSAVTGLILALVSWLILSTINPDILVLKSVGVNGAGTYSYSAGQNSCVANATGTGTAANPCFCIDGNNNVYAKPGATLGPTVTGTSISPCSVSVPTATSTITITFSEPLEPGSVTTGTINTYFPGSPPVTVALTSPTVVTITIGAPYLAANSPQEIKVTTGVRSAKGVAMNPATCNAAAGSPPEAGTAYDLRFTTDTGFGGMAACVSCSVGGSNPCQQICSNTTLANDNAFHCLVVHPKISTVSDAAIMSYNKEQIRALAVYDGTADKPFVIPDKSAIVVDAKNNSFGVNTPITFTFDDDLSGECDNVTLPDGMWRVSLAYSLFTSAPACKQTITPKGVTCSQKYCAKDSEGHEANSILYFTILAPS